MRSPVASLVSILLASVMPLLGCGGGSSSPEVTPAPPTPTAAPLPSLANILIAATVSTSRAVTTLADGSQVVAWSDSTGVLARRFDASGATGGAVTLSSSGTVDAVAALAGGGFVVQYERSDGVFVQVMTGDAQPAAEAYNMLGGPIGEPFAGGGVATTPEGFVAVFLGDGQTLSSGGSRYDPYLQSFDVAGRATSALKLVDPNALLAPPGGFSIASTATGGTVFAHPVLHWAIELFMYDSDLQWGATAISGFSADEGARVVSLSSGRLVLAWGAYGHPVTAQVYRYDAAARSLVRVVDSHPLPGTAGPAGLIALADGKLLVTWNSTHGQVFDATLQAASNEFLIGADTVAALPDNRIVAIVQQGNELVAQYYRP